MNRPSSVEDCLVGAMLRPEFLESFAAALVKHLPEVAASLAANANQRLSMAQAARLAHRRPALLCEALRLPEGHPDHLESSKGPNRRYSIRAGDLDTWLLCGAADRLQSRLKTGRGYDPK